ncbi:S41 family peptidase [Paenibacillus cisolokensis]|uniref:S41 family peptidase n=1 Tax=Paenibacillus TaxID=44249 RepID=UPI00071F5F5C|nr:S41 family peptidase [Paenibacillus sp. 32O-W]ALS29503.1 peptidase S41 [Paenibacillus sp. 32O-W]
MQRIGNVSRRRSFLWTAIGIALVALGFVGGRLSLIAQHPIIAEPAFRNLSASYNEIRADFLKDTDPSDLINGAAEGMVASLDDPYSRFLSKEKGKAYVESYEGEFVGIGVTVRQEDGKFIITSVIKDAPADKAGLRAEDVIVQLEGKPVEVKTTEELAQKLRGKEGTKVTIGISRSGLSEPFQVTLTRAPIKQESVSYEMREGGIGVVTVTRFAERTAEEFDKAVEALEKDGMKALLLDLRSNPGGLLTPTIDIANRLIPKDKTILQVVYKDEKRVITYRSKQEKPWELPIAVLTDSHSASASEVLAAALKESAGATVIGETTYGKGVVQRFRQFYDGSVLSLTEAQWRTPNGQWINEKGVEPTIKVSLPEYASLPPLPSGTLLKEGSYGEHVKTLQSMLEALGYPADGTPGLFDEATKRSLESFQRDEKLDVTGELNDRTSYRIVQRLSEKLKKEDAPLLKGIETLKQQLGART